MDPGGIRARKGGIVKRLLALASIILAMTLTSRIAYADVDVDGKNSKVQLGTDRSRQGHDPKMNRSAKPKPKPVWNCRSATPGAMAICTGDQGIGAFRIGNSVQAAVLTATRTIGLPSLRINIQPGSATLVNLDTIFYARPQPFARSVTLLGYDIDLVATPASYTWHPGDGSSRTTTTPGNPYPAKDITYRYQQPAKHLHPSVDVTYRVRYRVDGGPWQSLSQTLTATGQQSDLQVKEAGAVLASY